MMIAEAYLHAMDPFAVRFPDWMPGGGLRWYGLAYAAGFLLAWLIFRWFAKTKRLPMTTEDVGRLIVNMMVGVLIGGRLGYIMFYEPRLLGFDDSFPWWGVLKINEGGMASHGGVIGTICGVLWYAWQSGRRSAAATDEQSPRRRVRWGALSAMILDVAALTCTIGLCLGRVANFVNGELWGEPIAAAQPADPPWWSVKYPEEILRPSFDERLDELAPAVVAAELMGADDYRYYLTHQMENQEAANAVWSIRNRLYAIAYDTGHAAHEPVRDALRPLLRAYYPSQLLQALSDGPILALVMLIVWRKVRRPGVIGCTFLITYGALRIATEVFRQPDENVERLIGLSRGQQLSVLMIVGGILLLVFVPRRFAGWSVGPFARSDEAA